MNKPSLHVKQIHGEIEVGVEIGRNFYLLGLPIDLIF